MAYQILVSEEQRVALIEALRAAGLGGSSSVGPEAPLEYWVEMLIDLPAVEAANPGSLHGFCL